MADNKVVTVGNKRFYIAKIPALTALKLDQRVVKLCAGAIRMLGALKQADGKIQIDFSSEMLGNVESLITNALDSGNGELLTSITMDLLKWVQFMPEGQPTITVSGNEDTIFQDSVMEIYLLAFEVCRVNKFTPFALLSAGSQAPTDG